MVKTSILGALSEKISDPLTENARNTIAASLYGSLEKTMESKALERSLGLYATSVEHPAPRKSSKRLEVVL